MFGQHHPQNAAMVMTMKILMLSDVYFPRVNGVSTSIAHFRRELQAQGHEVWLIAPDYLAAEADPRILRLPARVVPFDPEDRIMSPRRLRQLLPRLKELSFDLLHVHTPFSAHYAGTWLARQLGVPCIETYHTFFEAYGAHYFPWLPKSWLRAGTRWLSRRQGNAVDGLIAPSRAMADALAGYGVKTPIEVIPTGIQPSEMHCGDGAALRRRLEILPEQPTMVFVSRIAHEKNLGFLLSVVERLRARIPELRCLIAGAGPAAGWLRTEVNRRGLSEIVILLGNLSRQGELQSCYRAGDVFVFPSRTETQGLVLLEAMAAGVPVVGMAAMGAADVLGPQRGCRVAADDVEDFADRSLELLQNRELRARIAEEAVQYADEWSAPAMAERLAAFYRRVLAGHGRLVETSPVSS